MVNNNYDINVIPWYPSRYEMTQGPSFFHELRMSN